MRVSYVRKIKDQQPLSQTELNIIKFTLMNAIKHHNSGVIEPLLTRGVPLLMVLYNNKTALRNAFEANNPKIVELLMIESMRTFQLFPVDDIIECFRWVLEKRHYNLVDLMLFAVKQNPKSLKIFAQSIQVIDTMDKIVDLYKKNEIQSYHLKEFEQLLSSIVFDKMLCFYLYHRWNKDIGEKYTDSTQCYRVFADFYLSQDIKQRKKTLATQVFSIASGYALSILLISGYVLMSPRTFEWQERLLPIAAIVGLGGLLWSLKSTWTLKGAYKKTYEAIQDRILMKACRDGDYAKVSDLINAGAHINCLCGIGETTALYEAMLFKNQPIVNLLQQFNAYSGQGTEMLVFP